MLLYCETKLGSMFPTLGRFVAQFVKDAGLKCTLGHSCKLPVAHLPRSCYYIMDYG
ncbi:hypothetical protein AG1IA_07182 [Rhizoctonia solani AG-1 IA]|uniref:Uncharacterized protein n=1 Tax=Thanatephorus cucumeris (strain AG1-IA) TaxID=983506 RepID=L8WKV0_THACA|nr:hypothetical protein AG1IA_07182 [Rhizoctonia solani AG-1 IA]